MCVRCVIVVFLLGGVLTACVSDVSEPESEWVLSSSTMGHTVWTKDVRAESVWYGTATDSQQACELLFGSPEFRQGFPSGQETYDVVLDVILTQGVRSVSSWTDFSHVIEGTEPTLNCSVVSDGSERWETYLPGVTVASFSESDLLDGREVKEGWKVFVWDTLVH